MIKAIKKEVLKEIDPNIQFHPKLPLGMIHNQYDKVFTRNGNILSVKKGKVNGDYVRYCSDMGSGHIRYARPAVYKMKNIRELYVELFGED